MRRRDFITILASAVATGPFTGKAQSVERIPRIGVLWHAGSAAEEGPNFKALVEGFNDLGYTDGKNVKLEHRFANETPERFTILAAELVDSKVDVLVSVGVATAPYAKNATATIPVVLTVAADPVAEKLVSSLARPGGNVTGLTVFASELAAKRLQLMKDVIPTLSRVALLVNPNNRILCQSFVEQSQSASSKLGLSLQTFEARSLSELQPAFDAIAGADVEAVSIMFDGLFHQGREIVPKLAIERRLPVCVLSRATLLPGALMFYGPDVTAIIRRTAVYVDKILNGANPADLPIEQPSRFQLAINLGTAKALGLSISPTVLALADELTE